MHTIYAALYTLTVATLQFHDKGDFMKLIPAGGWTDTKLTAVIGEFRAAC